MIDPRELISEEKVQAIRKKKEKSPADYENVILPQEGGQQNILSSRADISIVGGERGGGKSAALLLEACKDIENPHFRAILFRKEIDDLSDLIDTSSMFYSEFGVYNRSKNDMTWNFFAGGFLKFAYFNMEIEDFHDKYQGKQFADIGVDEITQLSYEKFKILIMSNRNAFHVRNRIVGTCNPDPDSWVRKYIDWWIGEDGFPIAERDGVLRYCYMPGNDPADVIWGETRNEVYQKCESEIMKHWKPAFAKFGEPKDLMIKSVTFIRAKLTDNVALMNSSPEYISNLFSQDEETKSRFLDGNWNYKSAGEDLIKIFHMERFFDNAQQTGDGRRTVSCDAALDGGDMCTMWLWVGNHIADLFTCKVDGKTLVYNISAQLERWHVREEDFTYDLNGIGKYLTGFFPKAMPFNNKEAVQEKFRGIFYNLKAQAFQYLADAIINKEISIEPAVLAKRISGKGYKNATVRERLMIERKVVCFREDDPTRLIDKPQMKQKIGGGASPDLIEGMAMQRIFNIKKKRRKPRNIGLFGGIRRYRF